MRNTIILHNKHWKNKYENIHHRDVLQKLLKFLNIRQILVLSGIRRSGKTTIFKLLINHLIDNNIDSKEILYINLDDPFFSDICKESKNLYTLLEESEVITGKKVKYLFLDEVQNVNEWEKFVKSIYDNEIVKKIFITGSNSSLLDGEFATLLSGRYINTTIYPLSFKEVVEFYGIKNYFDLIDNRAKILNILDNLLEYGSFFEVLNSDVKREIILSYYDTIIFKDCIGNNKIKNPKTFKEITHFIISNSTNIYSYNSIAKAVNSNEHTIKNFISYLEDAYLIKEITNFSFSLKKQIKSNKKIYITDNSFLAQTSFRFSKDYGKLLENLVFTELIKREYEVYFYNENFECDFIAKKDDEIIAIQVCYELNQFNQQRELNGLKKLPFEAQKVVITYNQNDEIDGIKIVSFWEYFYQKRQQNV